MIISLGVVDIPYPDAEGKTTGEVAEILEEKFKVMEIFRDQNIDRIGEFVTESLIGAMENSFAGGPQDVDPFAHAMAEIEQRFTEFIDNEEHGIHTKAKDAPLSGARKKRQYRRVAAKTTFVDSGLYRNNFVAWVKQYG